MYYSRTATSTLGPERPINQSFVPVRTAHRAQAGNRKFLTIPNLPKPPPVINIAMQRPTGMKVRGKENPNYRIVPRPQPVTGTDGMHPHEGYARGQKKGLTYSPDRPIDGQFLVSADSNYVFMTSKLGRP